MSYSRESNRNKSATDKNKLDRARHSTSNVKKVKDMPMNTSTSTSNVNSKIIMKNKFKTVPLKCSFENKAQNTFNPDNTLNVISEKIYGAYQCLNPTINEIIGNVFASNKNSKRTDASMYSMTREQYECAIKASKLAQEVNKELLKEGRDDLYLLKWKIRHFPAIDFNSASPPDTTSKKNISTSKIYIEKGVIDQLVELHKLLRKALQIVYKVAKRNENNINHSGNNNNKGNSHNRNNCNEEMKSLKSRSQQTNISHSTFVDELKKLQNEYNDLNNTLSVLRSILKQTFGSADDVRKIYKNKNCSKVSKSTNSLNEPEVFRKITDVTGARRCILDCLSELTEVRRYLKKDDIKETISILNQAEMSAHPDNGSKRDDRSHLHATLGGVPVVLKLSQGVITALLSSSSLKCNAPNKDNKEDKNLLSTTENSENSSDGWTANDFQTVHIDDHVNSKLNQSYDKTNITQQTTQEFLLKHVESHEHLKRKLNKIFKNPTLLQCNPVSNSSPSLTHNLIADSSVNSNCCKESTITETPIQDVGTVSRAEEESMSSLCKATVLCTNLSSTVANRTETKREHGEKLKHGLVNGQQIRKNINNTLFESVLYTDEIETNNSEMMHRSTSCSLESTVGHLARTVMGCTTFAELKAKPLEIGRESINIHRDVDNQLSDQVLTTNKKMEYANSLQREIASNKKFILQSTIHHSHSESLVAKKGNSCKFKMYKTASAPVALSDVKTCNENKISSDMYLRKTSRKRIRSHSKFVVTNSQLKRQGIHHHNNNIRKELETLGIQNLIQACKPAKCCRNSKANRKNKSVLPYSASLLSLPLDDVDIEIIKKRISSHTASQIDFNKSNSKQSKDLPPEGERTIPEARNKDILSSAIESKQISLTQLIHFSNEDTNNQRSSEQHLPWNFEVRVLEFTNRGSLYSADNNQEASNRRESDSTRRRSRFYDYPNEDINVNLAQSSNRLLLHHGHGPNQLSFQPWAPFVTSDISLPQNRNIARSISDTTIPDFGVFELSQQTTPPPMSSKWIAKPQELSGHQNFLMNASTSTTPTLMENNLPIKSQKLVPSAKRIHKETKRLNQNSLKTFRDVGTDPIIFSETASVPENLGLFSSEDIRRYRQLISLLLFPTANADAANDEFRLKGPVATVDASTSHNVFRTPFKLKDSATLQVDDKFNYNSVRNCTDYFKIPQNSVKNLASTYRHANCFKKPVTKYPVKENNDLVRQGPSKKVCFCKKCNKNYTETCTSRNNTLCSGSGINEYYCPHCQNRRNQTSTSTANHNKQVKSNKGKSKFVNEHVNVQYHFIEHCNPVLFNDNKITPRTPSDHKLSFTPKHIRINDNKEKYNEQQHFNGKSIQCGSGQLKEVGKELCGYHKFILKHKSTENLNGKVETPHSHNRSMQENLYKEKVAPGYNYFQQKNNGTHDNLKAGGVQQDRNEVKLFIKNTSEQRDATKECSLNSGIFYQVLECIKCPKKTNSKNNPQFDIKISPLNHAATCTDHDCKRAKTVNEPERRKSKSENVLVNESVSHKRGSNKSTQWPPVTYRNKMVTFPQTSVDPVQTDAYSTLRNQHGKRYGPRTDQQMQTSTEQYTQTESKSKTKNNEIEKARCFDESQQTDNRKSNSEISSTTHLSNIKDILDLKESSKSLDRKYVSKHIDLIISDAIRTISQRCQYICTTELV